MSDTAITFRGGPIFDGTRLLDGHAITLDAGAVSLLGPEAEVAVRGKLVDLAGDILAPGYVDLQVNGGDGVMFNDDQSVTALARIAAAHRRLGVATILPTLITDTPDRSRAAIEAAVAAIATGVQGIGGLHLEGPHLSIARKGAHDPALIRRMTDGDLAMMIDAAGRLPSLMVTLAPENVTIDQVTVLSEAGVKVSLGHTDTDFATAMAYQKAGARIVTHLFNAMSQLGSREPGLVGAALANGGLSAGLIADGIHVHPAAFRAALAAKTGPGRIFLISDSMAAAGTSQTEFLLNGRTIRRASGRLQLEDGTLAGADLDLTTAVNMLTSKGVGLETALAMATSVPAVVAGLRDGNGTLVQGARAWPIRLKRREGALKFSPMSAGSA